MVEDRLRAEREELRFAVVFNGGVSLAVWMGGVAHEMNELTREAGAYGRLMAALEVRARADVISGTSAGGINGGALALGQVNRNADLSSLRDVWGDQGRLESLLHAPFRGQPASLLRGDDVFLPELNRALHGLIARWDPEPVSERPIDLTITTTLLDGAVLTTTDTFGQPLTQRRHDGTFRFRRLEGATHDHFSEGGVADALALAARASAGFPLAFEPTLIPVDVQDGVIADPSVRPDMARFASWRADAAAGSLRGDRSRYAVDGGLLNNTPTQHALRAVQRMRAGAAVDRVLALVAPLPGAPDDDAAAAPDQPPSVAGTVRGLLTALTSQGNRTFVDDVAEHNRRAVSRRGTRRDVLHPDPDGAAQDPAGLAAALFPQYRLLRLRRDARDLAARVHRPVGWDYERVRAALEATQAASRPAVGYVPQTLAEIADEPPVPGGAWWWGSTPALDIADVALEYLREVREAWPSADHAGLREARERVHDAAATVRRVYDRLDAAWDQSPAFAEAAPDQDYWQMRLHSHAWLTRADESALEDLLGRGPQVTAALARLGETLRAGAPHPSPATGSDAPSVAAHAERPPSTDASRSGLEADGGLVGRLLGDAVAEMLDAVLAPTLPDAPGMADATARVALAATLDPAWRPLLDVATQPDPTHARHATWRMLAALHVASWTVGDELPTENTSPVRLTQISAVAPNPFATFSRTVTEKLGGASLSRFSGFLKRSWRMNDWTWGRCDAATMLLRILVTPDRIRTFTARHRLTEAADVVERLTVAAFGAEAAEVVAKAATSTVLGDLRRRAVEEVAAVVNPEAMMPATWAPTAQRAGTPGGLPQLAALLTYARHVAVVIEELPRLADAVRRDRADGANPRSRGEVFLEENGRLLDRLHEPPAEGTAAHLALGLEGLDAFDRAGVGREPLDEEAASDQMIRTAVTSVAVAATVADGPHSGLGFAKPATRAVRGVALLPYWVTLGLASGGRIARLLATLGLAVGGVLMTLALLGLLQGALAGVSAVLGAGVFLVALTYGAMRTGSHLHALLLAGAAALLLGVGWSASREGWDAGLGMGAVVGALLLVGGLVLLGSVPHPIRSPRALLEAGVLRVLGRGSGRPSSGAGRLRVPETRARRSGVIGSVVVCALLAAVLGPLVWWSVARTEHGAPFDVWPAPVVAVATVAVVVLAGVVVLLGSRGLRRWRHRDGAWQLERDGGTAGATAGWSVVYGIVMLLLAAAALVWWPTAAMWDARVVLGALLGFAVVLLTVVPWTVLLRARVRIRRRVRDALDLADDRLPETDRTGLALADIQERCAARLESLDLAYRFLVGQSEGGEGHRLRLRARPTLRLRP